MIHFMAGIAPQQAIPPSYTERDSKIGVCRGDGSLTEFSVPLLPKPLLNQDWRLITRFF